ncbi:hypothetical protein [Synechocystis sp. PCC 7509]|uniref:hypothetical protein n=1 Tax=Synechocystis sp. PCC 7509 TaxID=927677 RepID=UPI0002AC0F40|nr:hypothetical protein [Synechocystis sp. PCC 7509]
MKRFILYSSLLAIVGSAIVTTPAQAIPAIFRRTTVPLNLPVGNGVPRVIHAVIVPAGPRVINYSVTTTNFAAGEFVRCGLRANGNFLEQHSTVVGGGPSAANVATISGVWFTNFNAPYTLTLVCSHDGASASVPFLEPYAELAVF